MFPFRRILDSTFIIRKRPLDTSTCDSQSWHLQAPNTATTSGYCYSTEPKQIFMSSAVSPSGVIMVPANGNSGTPASNTAPSASSGVASTSSTNSSPSGSHAVSSTGGTPSKQPQLSGPLTDSSLGLSQSMEAVNAVGEEDNQEVRSHYHYHHYYFLSLSLSTQSNHFQPPNPLPTRHLPIFV